MLTFSAEGSGHGKLEIGGGSQPVSYEVVVARDDDETRQVRVRLNAPRDWLLKHDFKGEATLVRANGERISVRREGGLDVEDSVAVTLEGYDESLSDDEGVASTYPELKH